MQFCLHVDHETGLGQLLLQLALLGLKAGGLLSLRVTALAAATRPARAASRALRHSTIWLEYKPSRRNNAPFAPSGGGVVLGQDLQLVLGRERPLLRLLGHLGIATFRSSVISPAQGLRPRAPEAMSSSC